LVGGDSLDIPYVPVQHYKELVHILHCVYPLKQLVGLGIKTLTLVITQTSTLLPLPKSLNIPAHIDSTTSLTPSSLCTKSKLLYQIKISIEMQNIDVIEVTNTISINYNN